MKNTINILIVAFIAIFAFSACEKTVELDPKQTDALIVIEGLVTNELKRHEIKISQTVPFNVDGVTPRVSNASVQVSDNEGNTWNYSETDKGLYVSDTPFSGKVGNVYSMEIEVDGQSFSASEEMMELTTIDTMLSVINEEEMKDPEEEGEFYEVVVFMKEPQDREDYYLFKFFKNDIPENEDGTFIFAYDDEIIASEIAALPIPGYYALGDNARMEMYSITREAFVHFTDLAANINNDGGMFSGQPANVKTNIKGGALGYFQVSKKEWMEVVVEE